VVAEAVEVVATVRIADVEVVEDVEVPAVDARRRARVSGSPSPS
jgi:hypothetical protein